MTSKRRESFALVIYSNNKNIIEYLTKVIILCRVIGIKHSGCGQRKDNVQSSVSITALKLLVPSYRNLFQVYKGSVLANLVYLE